MQTVDRKFGQQFLLARAATRLRRFTISELHRATDVPENTIYSFVSRLIHRGNLETEELTSAEAGRPRKRYSLTDAGLDYCFAETPLWFLSCRASGARELLRYCPPLPQ